MNTTSQIAKHFREIYFGGNWTCSNLKEHLSGITVEQANTQLHSLNTICTLVHHIHYYVVAVTKVLEGGILDAKDELSFDYPPITSQQQWETYLNKVWEEAETFAGLIEQLPDNVLHNNIADPKYGIYYRNLHGIIEHAHYHLGQIVLIKKLLHTV